jgi:DNA polymerase gamma 1
MIYIFFRMCFFIFFKYINKSIIYTNKLIYFNKYEYTFYSTNIISQLYNFKHYSNYKKIDFEKNEFSSSDSYISNKSESRYNEINLQMLSNTLYKQIFGNMCNKNSNNLNTILSIKKQLAEFGILMDRISNIPNVDISIPILEGQDIEEHFKQIAFQQVEPYLKIINKLLDKIPTLPQKFILKEGWIRYSNSGYEQVEYPQEDGLIFDVEVCMKNGPLPTLATAVSNTSWYSWVSKHLIDGTSSNFIKKPLTPDVMISLESSKSDHGLNLNEFQQLHKVIVGHNVSFDRIRIKEQYWLNGSNTKFLDTMSMHICISGTNSYQRTILKSKHSNITNEQLHTISSLNNLADVYKLYCGTELMKTNRDIFINGQLHDIKKHFNESMLYCALDVVATHKVLKQIFPIFLERFPHFATLAGMLELGSSYLPVNYNWTRYLEETEMIYDDLNLECKICLSKRADQICRLLIDDKYKEDPWMWDQDWSIKDISLKKGYEKCYNEMTEKSLHSKVKPELNIKFQYLNETKYFLPKKVPQMPGYPNWYRKLCQKENNNFKLFPKTQNISTSMRIIPKLLNLTWENYPLYHIREHGWGFLVPYKNDNISTKLPLKQILNTSFLNLNLKYEEKVNKISLHQHYKANKNIIKNQPNMDLDKCCYFFKLPHKNGILFNVGNPLSKDFLNKFSENVLAGVGMCAKRILRISQMSSYWKNNRDRIISQLVVWLDSKEMHLNLIKCASFLNYGAIIPQVVVSGTLTRRAVEATWLTASNVDDKRIGSELRAMIHAPSSYCIVGADVDSQELWIASIIGDSFSKIVKIQGGTPFSWMTLIGTKSQSTDMHSITAKAIGISRDEAKIINYARLYGAGQKFAERLLKQFNPLMSDKEATLKSKKMYLLTKGQKLYRLKQHYISEQFVDKLYTESESFKISKLYNKSRKEIFEKGKWVGGSESSMFNSLEEIAEQKEPATPFLQSRLSRALEHETNEKYLPTKINWVVQSAAVDFLHLILVCMRWLMKDKAKLCISFHDEVRYLVPVKYKYNAALAMHVTNLLVRCFFVSRLKMNDLPMSVAFFTTVEIDSVLRKEANQDCITPSNPRGLRKGYGINHGESLNVWSAIKKSKGFVGVLDLK